MCNFVFAKNHMDIRQKSHNYIVTMDVFVYFCIEFI